MTRVLKGLLILLMLTPSLLWVKNAGTHRLGSSSLEGSRSFYELMRRVSAASYPVIHGDSLFLISVSDKYIYEYALKGDPEYIARYDVGGKDKVLLHQGDRIFLGFQTNRIKNRLVEVRSFDFNRRIVEDVTDSQQVQGDIANNILVYDGWFYLWGLEGDRIRLTRTDGVRIRTDLLDHTVEEGERLGFHLGLPIENLPVFEVRGADYMRAFHLAPEGVEELAVEEDGYRLPLFDVQEFQRLVDSKHYSRFYLRPKELMARMDSASEEWEDRLTGWVRDDELIEETGEDLENIRATIHSTDVYRLPELDRTDSIVDRAFLYPRDLAVAPGADTDDNNEGVRAQERVVRFYQGLLDRNREEMTGYMEEHQLQDYFLTPTSFMLILSQLLLIPAGRKIFSEGGTGNEPD